MSTERVVRQVRPPQVRRCLDQRMRHPLERALNRMIMKGSHRLAEHRVDGPVGCKELWVVPEAETPDTSRGSHG